jgi:CHAD domain-containing protein
MKNIDFYSKYSSDGEEALLEELKAIKEELGNVPEPDFSKAKSEESEEGSEEEEEENWGDDVDL